MARDQLRWNNISANANAGTSAFLSGSKMLAGALENMRAPLDRANKITQDNALSERNANTGALMDAIRRGENPELTGAYDSQKVGDARFNYKKFSASEARANATAARAAEKHKWDRETKLAEAKTLSDMREGIFGTGTPGETPPPGAVVPEQFDPNANAPSPMNGYVTDENGVEVTGLPEGMSESAFGGGMNKLRALSSAIPDINVGLENDRLDNIAVKEQDALAKKNRGVAGAKTLNQAIKATDAYDATMAGLTDKRDDMNFKIQEKRDAQELLIGDIEQAGYVQDFNAGLDAADPIKSGYREDTDLSNAITQMETQSSEVTSSTDMLKENPNYFKDQVPLVNKDNDAYNKPTGKFDNLVEGVKDAFRTTEVDTAGREVTKAKNRIHGLRRGLSGGAISQKKYDELKVDADKDLKKAESNYNKIVKKNAGPDFISEKDLEQKYDREQEAKRKVFSDSIASVNNEIARQKEVQGETVMKSQTEMVVDELGKNPFINQVNRIKMIDAAMETDKAEKIELKKSLKKENNELKKAAIKRKLDYLDSKMKAADKLKDKKAYKLWEEKQDF